MPRGGVREGKSTRGNIKSSEQPSPFGGMVWTETQDDGETRKTRTVFGGEWHEVRYDCFCCSCNHTETLTYTDAACRNHGFAARRPCAEHGTPGVVWGAETEGSPAYLTMPESVQEQRAKNADQ